MEPRKSGLTIWIVGSLVLAAGVLFNSFWYQVALAPPEPTPLNNPTFSSVALDFDGPFDDNTFYAGFFNVAGFALVGIGAVLFFGAKR